MKLRIRERGARLVLVAAVAVAGAAGLTSAGSAPATAEVQVTPPFQMPFPCGARWTSATHGGHFDPDMLDFVAENGATNGAQVVASAGGTVSASFYSSSGGEMIVIDHGDGWQTRYLHLSRRVVAAGVNVVQGQPIGNVGTTGASSGPHLHFEQKLNGAVLQAVFDGRPVPRTWSYFIYTAASANCGTNRIWVDTFADAAGYDTPGGTQTGTLKAGTSYVYCRVWGPKVQIGAAYNHWWLKTDLDIGPANQYVSAFYLSRWDDDEAKDNNGNDIPAC